MLRNALALILALMAVSNLRAQDWAAKMFEATSHDFGNVARGVKSQFRFKFKNIYEEEVHVMGVRSSCGCTTPQVVNPDLKTFEAGEIVADVNTRDFQGFKTATITVVFDKPKRSEVLLNVSIFIRTDVVVEPGIVDFGNVDLGSPAVKRITVTYTGRENWNIEDARTADPFFEVELMEARRLRGRVAQDMLVRLTKDAPAGYIKDQLILVTNDAKGAELPIEIAGRVVPAISVSPASLFVGSVPLGQKVQKTLIVRGKKPFKIVDIKCDDDSFVMKPSPQTSAIHRIPVEFTAKNAGKIARKIEIETDQGEGGTATFMAYAEVVKPASSQVVKANHSDDEVDDDNESTESLGITPADVDGSSSGP